ncbi:MAG: tetratricopeptide repeat protein, partial [Pseudobdellovibrio sp.]
ALKQDAETIVRASPAPPVPREIEIPKFDLKEFVENEIKAEQDLKDRMDGDKAEKKAEKPEDKKPRQQSLVPNKPTTSPLVRNNNLSPIVQNNLPSTAVQKNILDSRDKNLEIQMVDLKKLKQNEIKKVFPLILLLILLIGAAVYLYLDQGAEPPPNKGWTLQAPKKSSDNMSEAEVKELKKSAVRAFQSGVIDNLLIAQQNLIKAAEGSNDLETLGLLCMAYEQLWPFTIQSEEDLKAVLKTTQLARTINPISNFSDSCQATFLLSKGQTKEAKSLIERTLDNQTDDKFSLSPFLYYMKAEMLELETNYVNSEAYYEQSSKLWPQWIAPRFGIARIMMKQEKYSEARTEFEQIQKDYPESKVASYGLALIELKTTHNTERAQAYFANGYKIKEKMFKDFHAEALLRYAKILMDNKDNRTALAVAQEGFKISPGNHDLKDLVVSLGGDEKVESTNPEIIAVGKQFERVGDCLTAQAQYKAAFELNPKSGIAAYSAAKCLWQINQTREAINWLDKAINADPDYLQAYILKSDYESQKYNFAGAQKTLAAAVSHFSQSHELSKAMALLEFRKNNMYAAIQYGERALKMYDADVELLTLLAQADIYIYLNAPSKGKEDADKKDSIKKQAQAYAGRAVDLEPGLPEAQITYAKFLGADKGPVREEMYLKELIKSYPYTIEYRIGLAEFYKVNEKFTDSAKVYEEIISVDPKSKKANFGLAECYRILNKVELAQKYYNITSALDPSDVEAMFANAKLLIETASGREARAKTLQALAKLQLIKQINPDFPKVSFFMARCYLEIGEYDKSLEMVHDEKTRNPSIADSYILAAEIYYRKALFKECAAEYSGAIKLRPNSAELYVKASICYRNSDSLDIAEDMLQMAQDRENGFADIYREWGYVYEKKGMASAAVQFFEKYLVYSPNAPDKDSVNNEIIRLSGGKK